ncbi:MAG: hypothetical protein KUG74_10560 [Rhodobacteraceae bacterium]|nr:hypothetical protein [Paracoccaceae bacterium]
MIAQVSEFDARGNLARQTLPLIWADAEDAQANPTTFDIGTEDLVEFHFDALNRPIRTILADCSQQETEYATLKVAVVPTVECRTWNAELGQR